MVHNLIHQEVMTQLCIDANLTVYFLMNYLGKLSGHILLFILVVQPLPSPSLPNKGLNENNYWFYE